MTRRWNGWGSSHIAPALSPPAIAFLHAHLGAAEPPPGLRWEAALATVPAARLPEIRGLYRDATTRLRHARGQSFPDWVALRIGPPGPVADGVVFPADEDEVIHWLRLAAEHDWVIIPRGGGTAVLGQVNVGASPRPTLVLSTARLVRLRELDLASGLARIEAGANGPLVEAQLAAHGLTLGHFPQSFEYATLGGWVACRSSGQESSRYGRIETLFRGGTLLAPAGRVSYPPHPASAAGPDPRSLLLGAEGRLGVLSEAWVRVRPRPPRPRVTAWLLPGWEEGLEALRRIARARLPVRLLRLSDPLETDLLLTFGAGERRHWIDAYARLRSLGPAPCLLLSGWAGDEPGPSRRALIGILHRQGARRAPALIAHAWRRNRFRGAYLRNALWEAGYGVDTMESAAPWSGLARLAAAMCKAAVERPNRLAYGHVSHVYPDGASYYLTTLFPLAADAATCLDAWRRLKRGVTEAVLNAGGTLSHHHGVGRDHLPWMACEQGPVPLKALAAAARVFDPAGIMNPGKLFPGDGA